MDNKDAMNRTNPTNLMKSTGASETPVFVLDVAFGVTPEEAIRLISEPYDRGFYIHRAMEWPGGARIVYVRRATPVAKSLGKSVDQPAVVEANKPAATRESEALQFLRDNREMSLNGLAGAFKALGFPRSTAWIGKKRTNIIRMDRWVV